jgi:hypothetical protein
LVADSIKELSLVVAVTIDRESRNSTALRSAVVTRGIAEHGRRARVYRPSRVPDIHRI